VIRVNSQSGKGGVAWVLEQDKGLKLPKRMQADLSRSVQALADETSRELNAADIWARFQQHYRLVGEQPFELVSYSESHAGNDRIFTGRVRHGGEEKSVSGRGNGLLSSVLAALNDGFGIALDIVDYSEHAIGQGGSVQAAAYVEARTDDGRTLFGVGIDSDVATASVRALLGAANAA
jgi:2-isopropylmalate synthase